MKTFPVLNPFDGTTVGMVADLGEAEARDAVAAAHRALPAWSARPVTERNALLERWRDLISAQSDALARVLTSEQGKPLKQAGDEIGFAQACLDWVCAEASKVFGDGQAPLLKQPIGVVACLTPWNFPAAAVIIKCASALAAGCTVVLKPSDETPLIALAFAKLAVEAGIPREVLNVVTCKHPEKVGAVLTGDPRVRMLSFTGSNHVGKLLLRDASATVKRVALELGGNAPFIVFPDADQEQALKGAVGSKFYNAGQICLGTNRFFIHASLYERFVANFIAVSSPKRLGSGLDPATEVGPLINEKAVAKLESLIADAVSKGAKVRLGGKRSAAGKLIFEPTVLTSVRRDMRIYHEEIFGPVAAFYAFETEDEVLALANETENGLSAYFYTNDAARIARFTRDLEFGMVGVNTTDIASIEAPFGGIKGAGLGREGGPHCLDEFLEVKTVARR